MTVYTLHQRKKEMGVRKVLGASIRHIVFLLSKGFLRMIGIASVIAIPVAYLVNQLWLTEFIYRIQHEWLLILLSVGIMMGIGIITIFPQVYQIASTNPVDILRDE